LKVFSIEDSAAERIGEMVPAADLVDKKYPHCECVGIDRILKGWAPQGLSDDQLIEKGAELFDALHEFLRGKS
jgi:hypothetical protein